MKKIIYIIIAVLVLLVASVGPGYSDRGGHGRAGGYSHRGGYGHRDFHGSFYRGSRHFYGGNIWIGPGWGAWGPGWWGPPYYPYYYPYPSPPAVIEQQPPVYVQPNEEPEEQGYWYYCEDPQGYYPYVKKCPKGWLKVVPSPPDGEE